MFSVYLTFALRQPHNACDFPNCKMDTEYWIRRDWDPADAKVLVSSVAFNRELNKPIYFSAVYRLLLPRAYAAGLSDWFCLSVRPSVCPSVVCPLKNRAISRFTGLSNC